MTSAYGKVILFGEHAVVFGHPALALGIPGAMTVTKVADTPGPIRVEVQPWGLRADEGAEGPLGECLRLLRRLVPGPARGMELTLRAGIPPAAGLGSSAALSVALIRGLAVVREQALGDDQVRRLSHRLEEIFHGRPSGLDDTVATFGGLCLFQPGALPARGAPGQARLSDRALRLPWGLPTLALGHSGVARRTVELVAAVGRQRERDRARVEGLFAEIDACLADGLAALERGDAGALGSALDRNQAALGQLGLSCPEVEEMLAIAHRAGASGAKLTGAGGGGSVVAVAPGCADRVIAAWRSAGFTAWDARVEGSV